MELFMIVVVLGTVAAVGAWVWSSAAKGRRAPADGPAQGQVGVTDRGVQPPRPGSAAATGVDVPGSQAARAQQGKP